MNEIKTVRGLVKSHNIIEVDKEELYVVPMNYANVSQFIGYDCYIQLQKVEGGHIILEFLKVEEGV